MTSPGEPGTGRDEPTTADDDAVEAPPPRGPGAARGGPGAAAASIGPAAVVAFLSELALLGLAVVTGWRLGTPPWTSLLLAVVLVAVVVAVWGRWFAPTSAHRVRARGRRLAGQAALLVAVGALAAVAGLPWWGAAVAVVGITAFALAG
ncbi:DUF2568 domain-containing protein [Cellulomonas alba]|uniref:DUF2568 domain-containing protein n=1 Tax=Cellulomonas alba TaxID=3053467 RepID=A0ABT7SG03_9CELL|nr:DUF2568 domain-containing protein [Cellulomonas alba]MDM7855116.1 DUF2568 domain-containing protein [Cellulomonas alba]